MKTGYMWECECGNISYSEYAPDECGKCFRIDSYVQLPEEIVAEREKDMMEEEFDDLPMKKISKAKMTKPKLAKPKGRKKK